MPSHDVIRIERYEINGDPVERVSSEKCHCSGPDIGNHSVLDGDARVEWDRCLLVAEEAGLAHLIDPIWLRDHCLNHADGDPTDPDQTDRRAYWDIRSVPIKHGACCGGVADESHVPA